MFGRAWGGCFGFDVYFAFLFCLVFWAVLSFFLVFVAPFSWTCWDVVGNGNGSCGLSDFCLLLERLDSIAS